MLCAVVILCYVPPLYSLLCAVPYLIASKIMEKKGIYGFLIYLIAMVITLPTFGVMGEYGPAHIGMDYGMNICFTLFIMIIIKIIILTYQNQRSTKSNLINQDSE